VIFTSYTYVAFLLAVVVLHWCLPQGVRKLFLIAASYVFYCSWKWQYGFLLAGVSLFNWAYGRFVLPRARTAKPLALGILINLAPLFYFKYTNFALANVASVLSLFGLQGWIRTAQIVLPLGISFFTFQGIAYLIDVAAGEEPFLALQDFLLFKAFWPQLIAGPIIRPAQIREQIETPRALDYDLVAEGARRILLGFFKKVVLADMLAPNVELVFAANATPAFVDVAAGILGFGLQIYFDFSAYSDIAIGTARLFGFVFPENFNWPYTARSPREFWQRWHMTLSRWIQDYVFTPLNFATRRHPKLGSLWLVVAMAICGLWHGAQWTFVLWGVWHGILLLSNQTLLKGFFDRASREGGVRGAAALIVTFAAVNLGWLLFRAGSLDQAGRYLVTLATLRGGLRPTLLRENAILAVAVSLIGLAAAPWVRDLLTALKARVPLGGAFARFARPVVYALIIVAVIVLDQEARAFVYFQF
jgi:D-alanyl-lipoteichoic acid acyltransferase DltB (MBOAT superfamily)